MMSCCYGNQVESVLLDRCLNKDAILTITDLDEQKMHSLALTKHINIYIYTYITSLIYVFTFIDRYF